MPLHPQVAQLLDMIAAIGGPAMHELQPDEARQQFKAMAALTTPVETPEQIDDRTIPGPAGDLAVRVYTPPGDGPHPLLVWYHGGGWVIGDLDTSDNVARSLCVRAGVVIVSVDYRLAPEHPYPAPLDDCVAALRWAVDHAAELGADPSRVAIGGDSAGGNLAAATAIEVESAGPALRYQVLVYPVTDCTRSSGSYRENAEGYLLTAEGMAWFCDHYLGATDPADPRVSPLFAELSAALPPALVLTAEFDPLRDEGESYADRLRQVGVEVEQVRFDGQIHAFFSFEGMFDDARKAIDLAADRLRDALA